MIVIPAMAGGELPRRIRGEDFYPRITSRRGPPPPPPPPVPTPTPGRSIRNLVVVTILAMWAVSFAFCIAFPGNEDRTKVFQSITVAAPIVISAIFGLSKGT